MKTKEHPLESLTRGEEEIMQYLWQLEKGSVNDLLSVIQEPKPKYTTVATFIKILERKGYVGYDVKGKSYEYYPLISKEEYAHTIVSSVLESYFEGSLPQMVSFFTRREKLSLQDTDEILEIIRQTKNNPEQ
ncbi:MAG TPA: BlaI/MecI/CopY family transcriptional regulator [Candidatus Alistipes avicola]|uniref:BlaI/MecI/CopY family transcriptional regulator n=1 Tax=Candidatus Alistipes avicola TaxID=2838432 RepID=A0A9D2L377_9BACT|nr:BlaI/MecI/CopY family transcriptional regulator [uncultured Alistipes sp.]HJA98527.1 BlaI/MecI/CopY family transcriptional regulator [Candidatus Alistipes avicola]